MGFATADSPLGPWTKYEGNPILHRREGVSGPGHNSVVESPDGSELFIAYHKHQSPAGGGARQLAIDRMRVIDGEDGQVRLEVDGPSLSPRPFPSGAPPFARGRTDEFDATELNRRRWVVFREDPEKWALEDGRLVIRTQDGDVYRQRHDLRNLFLQYAPEGDFVATTRVRFEPEANFEQAFLMIWQDHNNYIKLGSAHIDGLKLDAAMEIGGEYQPAGAIENTFGKDVYLRIVKRGGLYTCWASGDGETWMAVGDAIEALFIQPKIGLGATAPVSGQMREARFEFLRLD